MERYHKLYMFCMAGMFSCLAVSIVLFLRLNIGAVISFFTGGRARREIRRLKQSMDGKTGTYILVWILLGGIWSGCSLQVGARQEDGLPRLTECAIDGEKARLADGHWLYQNRGEEGDVTVSFTIWDEEECWEEERVSLRIIAIEEEGHREVVCISGGDEALDWSESEGDLHRTSYVFCGEEDTEAEYELQIFYENSRGNRMIVSEKALLEQGSAKDGTYTGMVFSLDHKAPVFEIHCTKAVRLVDDSGQKEDRTDEEPMAGYSAYYRDSIKVSVRIQDENLCRQEDVCLELERNGEKTELPKIKWNMEQPGVYEAVFGIEKEEDHSTDGCYRLMVSCKDAAGNGMVPAQEDVKLLTEAGTYVSSGWILDTRPPRMTVSIEGLSEEYSENAPEEGGRRMYYTHPVRAVVSVCEENGRYEELRQVLEKAEVVDFLGETIDGSFQKSVQERNRNDRTTEDGVSWEFLLSTDANYTIPFSFEDLAGNRTELKPEEITVDAGGPELTLSYAAEADGFLRTVNYKEHGFVFSDQRQKVKVTVQDRISGVRGIRYVITDENGKQSEQEYEPEASMSAEQEFWILPDGSDFKGTVLVEAFDMAGNKQEEIHTHVVESRKKHARSGGITIKTKTSPSRTVDGQDYYNTDIHLKLSVKDMYSGVGRWSCSGGNTLSGAMDYVEEAGADLYEEPKKEVTFAYSEDMVLSASGNNENDVRVSASCTDNAGHEEHVEQIYHIDTVKPVITVEYDADEPEGGTFYRQARTAVVTIRERNFDEKDVDFVITNTDGTMPFMGAWSVSGSGDDTKHTCPVIFYGDGDYTFTLAFEDMAGNRAEYDRIDTFTIDRTAPVLKVTWDNPSGIQGKYYAGIRKATVEVLEHNFDPSYIQVEMTSDGGELPFVSGWRRDGDRNIASVVFKEDAEYTFSVSGTDAAGNAMNEYTADAFVIDKVPPKLEISGVEDKSANNGAVMPVIRCRDKNYDREGVHIQVKGYHNGIQNKDMSVIYLENGAEIRMDDFSYSPETDDLYTLEVTACDLAGNQSAASLLFSVNRFGSVYTFDEETARLAGDGGSYFTREAPDITVTETNVDTLKFREITCNLNGKQRTLTEGEDYTVYENGARTGWKQYVYTISRKNFKEEGTYILTVCSRDRADNMSDNRTKGRKIEFVVDRTAPSILISGVEDKKQYRMDSREITVDVQDNILLSKVEVEINKEKFTYSASRISELDGRLTFRVGSSSRWQRLRVTACDGAGNEEVSEEVRFLVTSNIFVQFYNNQIVFYSVMAVLLLLALSFVIMVIAFSTKSVL